MILLQVLRFLRNLLRKARLKDQMTDLKALKEEKVEIVKVEKEFQLMIISIREVIVPIKEM